MSSDPLVIFVLTGLAGAYVSSTAKLARMSRSPDPWSVAEDVRIETSADRAGGASASAAASFDRSEVG
jgi:hypothetical protein